MKKLIDLTEHIPNTGQKETSFKGLALSNNFFYNLFKDHTSKSNRQSFIKSFSTLLQECFLRRNAINSKCSFYVYVKKPDLETYEYLLITIQLTYAQSINSLIKQSNKLNCCGKNKKTLYTSRKPFIMITIHSKLERLHFYMIASTP